MLLPYLYEDGEQKRKMAAFTVVLRIVVVFFWVSSRFLGKLLRYFFSAGNLRLWDFSIGLGSDVISPLNFNGFGDPLNVLLVFAVGKAAVALLACCSFYFLYIQTILILVYALAEYFIRYPKNSGGFSPRRFVFSNIIYQELCLPL